MAWTGDYWTVTTNNTEGVSWPVRLQNGFYSVTWGTDPLAVPKPERKKNVRGLFEVFIVNPETDTVWCEKHVIANDADGARMKAIRLGIPPESDPEDYDVICRRVGDVRPKVRVKEVRVVKD